MSETVELKTRSRELAGNSGKQKVRFDYVTSAEILLQLRGSGRIRLTSSSAEDTNEGPEPCVEIHLSSWERMAVPLKLLLPKISGKSKWKIDQDGDISVTVEEFNPNNRDSECSPFLNENSSELQIPGKPSQSLHETKGEKGRKSSEDAVETAASTSCAVVSEGMRRHASEKKKTHRRNNSDFLEVSGKYSDEESSSDGEDITGEISDTKCDLQREANQVNMTSNICMLCSRNRSENSINYRSECVSNRSGDDLEFKSCNSSICVSQRQTCPKFSQSNAIGSSRGFPTCDPENNGNSRVDTTESSGDKRTHFDTTDSVSRDFDSHCLDDDDNINNNRERILNSSQSKNSRKVCSESSNINQLSKETHHERKVINCPTEHIKYHEDRCGGNYSNINNVAACHEQTDTDKERSHKSCTKDKTNEKCVSMKEAIRDSYTVLLDMLDLLDFCDNLYERSLIDLKFYETIFQMVLDGRHARNAARQVLIHLSHRHVNKSKMIDALYGAAQFQLIPFFFPEERL